MILMARLDHVMNMRVNDLGLGWLRKGQHPHSRRTRGNGVGIEPLM